MCGQNWSCAIRSLFDTTVFRQYNTFWNNYKNTFYKLYFILFINMYWNKACKLFIYQLIITTYKDILIL